MRRAAVILACLGLAGPALSQGVLEPEGFRMGQYRAAVPDSLRGAQVLDTEAAHALWQSGMAAFIDVLPRAPKPETLPAGTIWHDKPRHSIPGAIWLPNVGYGEIAEVTAAYFQRGLDKATGGDRTHPVVFLCRSDCWMSWNAAKRAMEYGFARVFWMPEGTDGWTRAGYPTEDIPPEPGF